MQGSNIYVIVGIIALVVVGMIGLSLVGAPEYPAGYPKDRIESSK